MNQKSILNTVIIGVCILVAARMFNSTLREFVNKDRQVSVKGLAEKVVPADEVEWDLSFFLEDNDQIKLFNRLKAQAEAIKAYGLANEITEEEITIEPVSISHNSYDYKNKPPRFWYSGRINIVISSNNVKRITDLKAREDELTAKGFIFDSNYINYYYYGLNKIKPEMIETATQEARKAAEKFAEDCGSKLGRIRTAYQGRFSIEDISSYPGMKKIRIVNTVTYMLDD